MERLEIDLREEDRQKIASFLTKLLASTYALYLKTQNYHWNVKGMDFFSLHVMFEKQYEEFAETIDEMAERIRALGHTIEGSLEAFAKISIIKGEEQLPNAKEMLARLLKDHEENKAYLLFLRSSLFQKAQRFLLCL